MDKKNIIDLTFKYLLFFFKFFVLNQWSMRVRILSYIIQGSVVFIRNLNI